MSYPYILFIGRLAEADNSPFILSTYCTIINSKDKVQIIIHMLNGRMYKAIKILSSELGRI